MSVFQVLKKYGLGEGAFIPSFAKLTLFFLFVLISSFTAIADAATYCVGPNGSDGYVGTSSEPWATFSKAMTVLRAGDTLLIKNGTYYQSLDITVSGTQGNPVTIKSENDGQAIIDPTTGLPVLNPEQALVLRVTAR